MNKIIWAIQTNLGSKTDIEKLINICQKESEVFTFEAIPFDTQLPALPSFENQNVVVYGSGNVTNLVYESHIYQPGVFSGEKTLPWSMVQKHYLNNMWSQGTLVNMLDFIEKQHEFHDFCFVRPDYDSKSFTGGVWQKEELVSWIEKLKTLNSMIDPSKENIIVAPIREINQEYRLFIVDSQIVTGSLYREKGELKKRAHIPDYVLAFVGNLIKSWTPCDAFVMDIAVDENLNMGVIELNSINSSGFYAANIEKYVKSINQYIENQNVLSKLKQKKLPNKG